MSAYPCRGKRNHSRYLDLPCSGSLFPTPLASDPGTVFDRYPLRRRGDIYMVKRTAAGKPGWGRSGSGPPPRARGCCVRVVECDDSHSLKGAWSQRLGR